jgi:hypothetical protein
MDIKELRKQASQRYRDNLKDLASKGNHQAIEKIKRNREIIKLWKENHKDKVIKYNKKYNDKREIITRNNNQE